MGKRKVDKLRVRPLARDERGEWDRAVRASPQYCVFSTSLWLSTYPDDAYEILAVESDSRIVGGIVVDTRPNGLFRTKLLGPILPVLRDSDKLATRYEFEKRFLGVLARAVREHCPHYVQRWHPSLDNWLPFHWEGFDQTVTYTYVVDDLRDTQKVWDGLQTKIRGDIRKAERDGVTVLDGDDKAFLAVHRAHQDAAGSDPMPESELYARVIDRLGGTDALRMRVSIDASGNPLSATLLLLDGKTAYYWAAVHHPRARGSGAQSLLLWRAFNELPTTVERFDFLGSSFPDIERYFRGFGGRLTPVFQVQRPPPLGIRSAAKRIRRAMAGAGSGYIRRRDVDPEEA